MFLLLKSIHIISVVSWFSCLFYLVRLFVYQKENEEGNHIKVLAEQYKVMQQKLWKAIGRPAAWMSLISGGLLLATSWPLGKGGWMFAKLVAVVGLIWYHWFCGKLVKQDNLKWSSIRFRLFNEVATIFLVFIVTLVVFKNNFNFFYGAGIITLFAMLVITAVLKINQQKTRYRIHES